jgi:lactate permease
VGVLSAPTTDVAGAAFPSFSGSIGAFDVFIAGSNTVSHPLWSVPVPDGPGRRSTDPVVVAAQAAGGAIGNFVVIHDVVAALTVVGLIGEEGRIIRLELIPVLYYGVATGVLALLLAHVVVPGAF